MADVDPRAEAIYQESVRGLDMQSASLDELRNRTGVLLAAATVASAFLGATALGVHGAFAQWVSAAATLVFASVIGLCLAVLWPAEDWEFVYDARTLDAEYIEKSVDGTAMYRSLAKGNAKSREINRDKLRPRFTLFRIACALLAVDVALWLLAIGLG
jgi:hypothetical protein